MRTRTLWGYLSVCAVTVVLLAACGTDNPPADIFGAQRSPVPTSTAVTDAVVGDAPAVSTSPASPTTSVETKNSELADSTTDVTSAAPTTNVFSGDAQNDPLSGENNSGEPATDGPDADAASVGGPDAAAEPSPSKEEDAGGGHEYVPGFTETDPVPTNSADNSDNSNSGDSGDSSAVTPPPPASPPSTSPPSTTAPRVASGDVGTIHHDDPDGLGHGGTKRPWLKAHQTTVPPLTPYGSPLFCLYLQASDEFHEDGSFEEMLWKYTLLHKDRIKAEVRAGVEAGDDVAIGEDWGDPDAEEWSTEWIKFGDEVDYRMLVLYDPELSREINARTQAKIDAGQTCDDE